MLNILAAHDPRSVPRDMIHDVVDTLIQVPIRKWEALGRLFDRPWFERIWVIQEAAKASQACVLCGNQQISWESIVRAGQAVVHNSLKFMFTSVGYMPGGLFTPEGIESFRRGLQTATDYELFSALVNTRAFKATDPRDKVFGLWGLVSKKAINGLEVNYSMEPVEIYKRVALYLFSRCGLTGLSSAGKIPVDHEYQIPTWVPNWSYKVHAWNQTNPYYSASGMSKHQYSAIKNLLLVRGQFVDSIRQQSDQAKPIILQDAGSHYDVFKSGVIQKGLLGEHWMTVMFGEGSRLSEISPKRLDEFWRALIGDRTADGHKPPPALLSSVRL